MDRLRRFDERHFDASRPLIENRTTAGVRYPSNRFSNLCETIVGLPDGL
jgi:hypothetical protein